MMDSELYYSLCLAIPNLRGTNSFYRIADYNPDYREFSQAKYEYSSETPLQISSSKEEGNAYKVEIRKWFPIDEKKQMSFYEELRYGYIYEVVFPEELIHQPLSDDQLREVLYEGISLPDGIARYFLLVLDVTSELYRVLLCDKNAFKYKNGNYYIEKQIKNLENAITEFDLIYIYNDQIISTELLRKKLTWYRQDKLRYFYNSVILPESTKKFQLRKPGDYTVGFFSNYLKNKEIRSNYSNQERLKLLEELEYIENNIDIIEHFFDIKDHIDIFSNDIFKESISNIINYIIESESTEFEMLLGILEKNPIIKREYEKMIEVKWLDKSKQRLLEKENELELVGKQFDKKEKELNNLINEINEEKANYQELKKELRTITEKKISIEDEINKELKNFQNNIVEQFKLSAFANENRTRNFNNSGIIEYFSEELADVELQTSIDLIDIFEGIKFNLENFMDNLSAERYATLIIAILNTNKLIILPEFQSEEIANAISLIVSGQSIKTINILNDNYDLNFVIEQVNLNADRYVLIKGHLDMFNETAVNTLINKSKNKNILFSINDEASLNLFSKNLWNYCIYLNPLDSFDMLIEKKWMRSDEVKIDIAKVDISTNRLSSGFLKKIKEETLFTQYAQEEFLYLMEVYTTLYKEFIDRNYEITSIKDIPLSHQIVAVNRNRVSDIESYLLSIGIEENILKYYK
ncbi:hypothetical protein FPV24_05810 [Carnobacterium sp. PL24RED07]|nr:hypothetical protein [Carnobacterium sp. PL24RED07]KAF3301030.1 hypothetical protein FPV22_05845 [Carnobacterium sp. PL26RED25]KAF3305406.1 hypothetical protein FPV24_05810 [Carnobacterium sp. PL24RED07]